MVRSRLGIQRPRRLKDEILPGIFRAIQVRITHQIRRSNRLSTLLIPVPDSNDTTILAIVSSSIPQKQADHDNVNKNSFAITKPCQIHDSSSKNLPIR